ncbi:alpha/beta fold hydrolase [Erythrobacter crassostreae]|uniref:Alpha/beta hydrolase n=1 Tax=Erythrobacter crassostreae TaxID=2828328 RepID=A0A9X1F272_9SPHN|nr:alpha/beta hydrolase [Erythrobacter crassostrea]MBV7258942.1 alpha/beta hydrolase [Erythrobacter crassostrea]
MTPTQKTIAVNDISLVYFEWNGGADSQKPPMIFAHATGFHARVWDSVIAHFPDRHIYALDMRGHGRSTGGPIENWQQLSGDVCAFLDSQEIKGATGIGHSMGAHTLLQSAADRPDAFSNLVLFDPVILAPEFYADGTPWFTPDNPHPSIRRKRNFDGVEAMIARFEARDPYEIFERRVFEDYCRHGLLPKANGQGFELACPPEVEASVYASSRSNSAIHETAKSVDIPATIVRAKQTERMDFKGSPTWPDLASTMPQGTDMPRPDMTHFHPFEDSADAARIIAEAMAA